MLYSGRLLALSANIIIGWGFLQGTNTLAYNEHSYITDEKSFITLGPVGDFLKHFTNVGSEIS